MRTAASLIIVTLLAIMLTGCGGRNSGSSYAEGLVAVESSRPLDIREHKLTSPDDYIWNEVWIKLANGHTIHCIKVEADGEWPVSITCPGRN